MRVLHVITGLAAGGAEQQLRLLLRHQAATAEVVTLTNPGSVARAMRADGTVVHHLGMNRNTDLVALPRLVRLIRAGRYDLVHTHLYRACVYGRVAARLAGVRAVVATEHSLGDRQIERRRISPGVRRLYLATERLGRATIAVSRAVADRLTAWGVPPSRLVTIPNGIEIDRYRFDPVQRQRMRARLGIAPERFVVGTVGRLVPGKRTDLMLHAIHGQPGVCGLVVGDGPEQEALKTLARRHATDVTFVGETTEVPAFLSAMDMLVAPSSEETFGLSVLEALAAGLPVAYVTCPALDDLPPGHVPQAQRVSADSDAIRRAIAAAAHHPNGRPGPPRLLAQYDIARVAAHVDAVYRRVSSMPANVRTDDEEDS